MEGSEIAPFFLHAGFIAFIFRPGVKQQQRVLKRGLGRQLVVPRGVVCGIWLVARSTSPALAARRK